MPMTTGSAPEALVGGKPTKKPLQRIAETMHKGGLHEALGIPQGEKIPEKRIEAATHSEDPKERKQAILAETFAHHRPGAAHAHHGPAHEMAHRHDDNC